MLCFMHVDSYFVEHQEAEKRYCLKPDHFYSKVYNNTSNVFI